MAGHSKFKNIMHRKGRQDAQRSKLFSKLSREITVAAKMGNSPDPDMNPQLRLAVATAKGQSMPKDNIERAIQKAFGNDGDDYMEIRYEGYGTNGIAFIVDTLTDNKNRTASEVRSTFTKYGGSLGETGSVSFMFDRLGLISYDNNIQDEEKLFEELIEFGADDLENEEGVYNILTQADKFGQVLSKLQEKYDDPKNASLIWRAKNYIDVSGEDCRKILTLYTALEDLDNVQNVSANFNMSDEDMQAYSDD